MLLASTIRPSQTISSASEKETLTTSMNSSRVSLESSPGSRFVAMKSLITSSVKPGVVYIYV